MKFTPVSSYSGRRGNGAEFSAEDYSSTDGVSVIMTVETYTSVSRAKEALRKRIREASRIVERSPKVDGDGTILGERVVLSFAPGIHHRAYATILWLEQEDLHEIESTSLRAALEFERQLK